MTGIHSYSLKMKPMETSISDFLHIGVIFVDLLIIIQSQYLVETRINIK